MMLAALRDYAARDGDSLPSYYASTPVAWIVDLGSDGRPLSPQPTCLIPQDAKPGQRAARGADMAAPEIVRAAGIKPLLLADKGDYTFGSAADPDKPERATRRHRAYRDLLDRCADATGEAAVRAVQRFYEHGGAALLELPGDWETAHKTVFRVHLGDGALIPTDLASVQQFWAGCNQPAKTGQCLVCGERKPIFDRLPGKIKGIPGGQSAGTAIISANDPAFESYGLEASNIAPTCLGCAEGFTRGLNTLLADRSASINVSGAKFVFWAAEQSDGFDLAGLLDRPDPAAVRSLLESAWTGSPPAGLDATAFYAVSLTASGGRAVVRDWIDTTVAGAEQSMARWFAMQKIANPRKDDPSGEHPEPLGVYQLAASTVREAKDLSPTVPRALVRAALSGTPLPMGLAYQAVRRNRAEQKVSWARAALIKLVLQSQQPPDHDNPEDRMAALDPHHPDTAYHCGRLLAALESAQRAAMPGVNATIVDRFYGAASSSPATVFGRLIRGAQPHLSKLAGPARTAIERRIGEACEQIGDFPRTLNLEQQALFALGYYHQRSHDIAQAMERKAARSAANTAETGGETETTHPQPEAHQ